MIVLAGWRISIRSRLVGVRSLFDRLREADGELMRLQADSIAGYERTIPMLTARARAAELAATEWEAKAATSDMERRIALEAVPSSDRQVHMAEFATAVADAESVADSSRDPDPEIDALWSAIGHARYLILEHPK